MTTDNNEKHDPASPVVKQSLTTAAAQEAVGWQWRWLDTDNTWSEWVDGGSRKEIDARIARWKADGEDHRMQVRPVFAARVTAAPVIDHRSLIEKWRNSGNPDYGDCADDLEALIDASPKGGCNWPDCGYDTNGVGYSPGCTGIGCHKGGNGTAAGLLSAAKDFYNGTVADPAVRISCSTKERRDRVQALGERLRDRIAELKAAQAGDAEVQP